MKTKLSVTGFGILYSLSLSAAPTLIPLISSKSCSETDSEFHVLRNCHLKTVEIPESLLLFKMIPFKTKIEIKRTGICRARLPMEIKIKFSSGVEKTISALALSSTEFSNPAGVPPGKVTVSEIGDWGSVIVKDESCATYLEIDSEILDVSNTQEAKLVRDRLQTAYQKSAYLRDRLRELFEFRKTLPLVTSIAENFKVQAETLISDELRQSTPEILRILKNTKTSINLQWTATERETFNHIIEFLELLPSSEELRNKSFSDFLSEEDRKSIEGLLVRKEISNSDQQYLDAAIIEAEGIQKEIRLGFDLMKDYLSDDDWKTTGGEKLTHAAHE